MECGALTRSPASVQGQRDGQSLAAAGAAWPAALSGRATYAPQWTYTLPAGLRDQIQGQLQQDANGGAQLTLSDVSDSSLQVVITISDPQATSATVAVNHAGQSLCSTQVSITWVITATCGGTALSIERLTQQDDGTVVGLLVTQAG